VEVLDAIFAFEVLLGIEAEPEPVRLPVRLADRTGVWLDFLRAAIRSLRLWTRPSATRLQQAAWRRRIR
jgi:hypothetical protein